MDGVRCWSCTPRHRVLHFVRQLQKGVWTMVLTVRLDPKTQQRLAQLARATGRSQSEIVRDALRRYALPVERERTLYDRFADVIGIVNLGPGDRARRIEEILHQRFARSRRSR